MNFFSEMRFKILHFAFKTDGNAIDCGFITDYNIIVDTDRRDLPYKA